MSAKDKYTHQLKDITERAASVRAVCMTPQFEDNVFIQNQDQREQAIMEAAENDALFSTLGEQAKGVAVSWGQAIADNCNVFNEDIRDEVLASAHKALENFLVVGGSSAGQHAEMLLESANANTSTSNGVLTREQFAGLILPVSLRCSTGDAATHIPANKDETELFEILRVAGNSFGDTAADTVLTPQTISQFSAMKQRYKMTTADDTVFTFDTQTQVLPVETASNYKGVKEKRNKIFHNGKLAAHDSVGGIYQLTTYGLTVFAAVAASDFDQAKGTFKATLLAADAAAVVEVAFEIDIEKRADLIPTVSHKMVAYTIYPSQHLIAAQATVQAYWQMQREYGIDLTSLQMSHMREFLAYEKDKRNLQAMYQAAIHSSTFGIKLSDALYYKETYELLRQHLIGVSSRMVQRTEVAGLTGIFVGINASGVIKSLGAPAFQAVEGYTQEPNVHYIGRLFGQYKVFESPVILGEYEMLCYARGNEHGRAGFVTGDAIPPIMFRHPTTPLLEDRSTLWELAYNDVHPNNGQDWFELVTLDPAQSPMDTPLGGNMVIESFAAIAATEKVTTSAATSVAATTDKKSK